MPPAKTRPTATNPPVILRQSEPGGRSRLALSGDWTTLGLAYRFPALREELKRYCFDPDARWDFSAVERLDNTGALLLWRAWWQSFPTHLVMPEPLREYFAPFLTAHPSDSPQVPHTKSFRDGIEALGTHVLHIVDGLSEVVPLVGMLALDLGNLLRHPQRWPGLEVSATIYRAGAQALGILALVGFLIGIVLSYIAGEQLHRLGAEIYVVNLLGIGCVRELGPLLAAILVAGRSGSSMTAQLGVMRLNEELDALTTMGVRYTQRLILPKVVALAIAQPLAGLWTSAMALIGGMLAAHRSLGIGYPYFLRSLPNVVPASNYWLGLGKGVVFGVIIAFVASYFGLRIKPNTESLGAGTTSAVVIAISSVLVADAAFAVLFSHVGTGV